MTSNTNHALVTGATSGLGLEAAAQLAEAGWAKVTVTGRTEAKAKAASATLAQRTGKDVFSPLALDLNNPASVKTAAAELAANGDTIDFLLLNAGIVPGSELRQTDSGIDVTFSSSLIGHHQLTMQILEDGLLAERAKIVIAGSEAARGDMPTFKVTDLSDASKRYNGDLVATAVSVIRGEEPEKFKAGVSYSNAKLFVAWWSQQLADKLPNGMTVNAISPGSAPETNAGRNANGFMKYVMLPMFKYSPKFLGMKHSVAIGASRYLQALEFGDDVSGEFFASRPKKVTGSLERMKHEHFHNLEAQQAGWKAIVKVSNGIDYPVNA